MLYPFYSFAWVAEDFSVSTVSDHLVHCRYTTDFDHLMSYLLTSANLDLTKDRLALKRGKAVLNKTSMLSCMEYTSIIQ